MFQIVYLFNIKFFGGSFLLFLFPTGRVHSQFKSTKVIFIKVGRGHTYLALLGSIQLWRALASSNVGWVPVAGQWSGRGWRGGDSRDTAPPHQLARTCLPAHTLT